jgi:carbon-monoxide dehydrogenase large subunit
MVGAFPAIANAIFDALAPFVVDEIDAPAIPYRVWRAMKERRAK